MRQFEQQMTVSGNSPHTLTYPEAAAQSFEKGAPVFLSSGKVTQCATAPAAILGVAAMPATGVTDSKVTVWVANDDTLFAGEMAGATLATVGTLVVPTKTGALWTFAAGAGGTFMVMEVGTALPGAVPIVRGKFLESATQLNKAA